MGDIVWDMLESGSEIYRIGSFIWDMFVDFKLLDDGYGFISVVRGVFGGVFMREIEFKLFIF